MRNFTKSLLALALMFVCVGGAKAEQVYKIVYSDYTSFPFYVMGFTPSWVGGIMTDEYEGTPDGNWHQYYIANDIPTVVGNDYKVKALVRSSANLTFNIEMRWGWSGDVSRNASVTIPQSNEFVEVEWEYKNIGGTSCGIIAQPWDNPKIEWKELAVYTADSKYTIVFGDLHTVSPHMYAKNAGELYGAAATPDVDGVYTIQSVDNAGAADWDTQFWIATPEVGLSEGKKFYVEFYYKADHNANVETQTQRNENSGYVTWHCVGESDNQHIAFTTDWKSIKKEVTIESDMVGWKSIAFNLNCDKTANKYYFKDIVLKVPEVLGETVDFFVGSAGWATYSSAYNVDLGTSAGYKAHYNGTNITLSPVTEVPAGEAVVVEGAGKHTFNVIPSATAITDNDLLVSDGTKTSDGTYYALGKKGDDVGFVKVKSGVKIPAGKAYMIITGTGARDFFGFDDATAISEIENGELRMENSYFNLAGQRVAQPTKGLYIVNGKKVIIK